MIIVGIGKAHHDCSICVNNNGVVRYAKYEREIQEKHACAPEKWYTKKLSEWNISDEDIDLIVQTDNGIVAGRSGNSVNGIRSKGVVIRLPFSGEDVIKNSNRNYTIDHHLAHAWSMTTFNKNSSAVIIDGNGSGGHTVMVYDNGKIERSKLTSPGFIFYTIGRKMNFSKHSHDCAGKVMGLIPYGNVNAERYNLLKQFSPNKLLAATTALNLKDSIPPNENSCQDWQESLDNMATINELCYDFVKYFFSKIDKTKPIHYSGGVALNVDWNRKLLDEGYNLIIEPAPYDGGLSIGCMRYGCDILGISQPSIENFPYIQDDETPSSIPSNETIKKVANLLADGKIVGWYQGHGEFGPRALGNRSILMDPRIKNGKDILNSKVKHREWFRPFGASVKQDKASKYFDLDINPYMLFTSKVLVDDLPSITHIDVGNAFRR
jgi:carbamoyltransferase